MALMSGKHDDAVLSEEWYSFIRSIWKETGGMKGKRKTKVTRRAWKQAGFGPGGGFAPGRSQAEADGIITANLPDEPQQSPGSTLVDESIGGPINHPKHYNEHPSGVECISVIRWETLNLGNVMKYIWRLRDKTLLDQIKDLKKAEFYLRDEIERLEGVARWHSDG